MDKRKDFFPVFLDLKNTPVLVVGAGRVAARKIESLIAAGAHVTVVAPKTSSGIEQRASTGEISIIRGRYNNDMLDGISFVFVASSDKALNRRISKEARKRRIPVNTADSLSECSFILPAVVHGEGFTAAISTGGKNPGIARAMREFLETHRAEISVRIERGRRRPLAAARKGVVYIIGAGPGNPDLLTVRALGLLRGADAVIHDYLVPQEILSLAPDKALRVCFARRGRTAGHGAAIKQDAIHRMMVRLAKEGKSVVRLKSGDPLMFGRGGEEAAFLSHAKIPFEIVPGITAAIGCAAAANLPLTQRGLSSSVTFAAGHEAGDKEEDVLDWKTLPRNGTIAIYMGIARVGIIARELSKAGFNGETPFAIVENGTRPEQRIIRGRLKELPKIAAKTGVCSPAMLFVGRTAQQVAETIPAHTIDSCRNADVKCPR
ncbi:MAG: uroporphyrinogen-III C-methyltransferase [Syntrophorhabdaceae bacterium]|nr:uroporphyrinogen-III C-methyltransferase [Syntrophorhabdaceae bacterium]